jgi:hypothetical protein
MKRDKYFFIYVILFLFVVSIFYNYRGCEKNTSTVDATYIRRIDSLHFTNIYLQRRLDDIMSETKRSDSLVDVLRERIDLLDSQLISARVDVKRMRLARANNDKKIKSVMDSKVDLSDEDMLDYFKTKLPK